MAFIKESVIKKYSVLLPYIGGTVSLLALVLQAALDNQVIPFRVPTDRNFNGHPDVSTLRS